jgi:hypothetical protein
MTILQTRNRPFYRRRCAGVRRALLWGRFMTALSLMIWSETGRAEAKETKPMTAMERNGRFYVAASVLEREAGIVVKPLPGQDHLVACVEDRCALVKDYLREGTETYLAAQALAAALNGEVLLDAERKQIRFKFAAAAKETGDAVARVGMLAPNFRLTKLDGTTVSLADLRGRRILINSWASW